ncbi:hypothetical protein [Leucothrix pacifica]|uniref:Uncharacterized protein n=1 Tax=Leucothrix pacifica TaxID=1247513 RepID=A0A317CF47_9GAMM|nr:hypothetical protein [Leucothrix pacifica]PWQ97027.1 hypothetical protein DKW60_11435 [Leucothrix pacifica]
MKKLSTSLIFTLMAVFANSAYAWPEVDHMNMCGAASKVIRDYKGNPQAWNNRDMYTESRKATLYFQANCPETKAGKIEKAVVKRVASNVYVQPQAQNQQPRPQARPASCKDCFDAGYKKGFKDGKSVGIHNNPATSSSVTTPPSYRQPQPQVAQTQVHTARPHAHVQTAKPQHSPVMIQHGDHQHHSAVEKADCELTDALNRRAGPVVTVIKRRHHH